MPTVKFLNEKTTIDVPEGANLRKEALKNGIELYSGVHRYLNCRGLGLCTSCCVLVKKGHENVSRQSWFERFSFLKGPLSFFKRLGREQEARLACRMKIHGDVEVETRPSINWHGESYWS